MSAPISLEIFAGFALFALVFAPLERWLPQRRQSIFRTGWSIDVSYYVLGCFLGHCSDALTLGGALLIRQGFGLGSGHWAAAQPGWLQFIQIVLIADFLSYWYHRALHRIPWLWRLHRVHHTSEQMDWLANVRMHPLDKVSGDCFQFIPIFLIGFSTGPLLAYTFFLGFQSFLNHANVKLNYGSLRWLVASPLFHHWHHCNDPKFYDKNFSPHLVIWDRVFGTFHVPSSSERPQSYGVPDPLPESLWGHMISPFR